MTAPYPYWAFISYSDSDRASAIWLQRALETYRVPRRLVGGQTPEGPAPRRFRPIFRDRTEMAVDPDLAARIQAAMEGAAWLIVVCSPDAARSHWVEEEIVRFKAVRSEDRILTVIVAGSATGDHQDCFPPSLRYRDVEGGVLGPEPLAADLRPGGDGKRIVRLKLVAAMLGVGLDELVRRDDQRRHRRIIAGAAAALTGMAVMGALTITALQARNEAQRQRAQAEDLIEFMLSDLRDRLDKAGRIELMDGVGVKALKYYAAQHPGDLDATSLGRRSRALHLMGTISLERGRLGQALGNFEQASATTRELLTREPDNGDRIFDHAQSVFYVGYIAQQRGEMEKAEIAFQQYRALAEHLIAINPAKDDWWAEVAFAYSDLGTLFLSEGRADRAAGAFRHSLDVVNDLARRQPANVDRQLGSGQGHAWLADALEQQGRLADARAHRLAELAIYQAILAKDPTMEKASFSTVPARRGLAREALLGGDLKLAIREFGDAAARIDAILAGQPDNMLADTEAALCHVELGEALLAAGQPGPAGAEQKKASALAAIALGRDATVKEWRDYARRARLLEGAIDERQGRSAEALALDERTLNELNAVPAASLTPDPHWLLNQARLQTADDLAALGRPAPARALWSAIIADLPAPTDRYEPRELVVLEAADLRLGRAASARLIARRLEAMTHGPVAA